MTRRSPSRCMIASSPGSSNSTGMRTAWLRPLRNSLTWRWSGMGLPPAYAGDICQLAADFKQKEASLLRATRLPALMHRQRRLGRWALHRRDAVLHRLLHLLEGAHLDLAHALARDAEFLGEFFQRDRIVRQPSRLEDATLALVQHRHRIAQRAVAVVGLFVGDDAGFLADTVGVDQPVLPFARVAVLADRRIERSVAAEAAVHVDHVLLGNAEALRDQLD